jgi:type IV secretion system protein VirD4
MLGCTDDVTANYFSARSGDMSIQVQSTMTTKQTMAVAQMIPQYRETQGHGRRKLLTPDEVLRLPHKEMLVIIRGQNILKLTKFDYTRHPMSKELVPVSIMNYVPAFEYRSMQPYKSPVKEPERKEEPKKPTQPRKPKKENKTAPPEDF